MSEQTDYPGFYAQAFRQFVQNSLETQNITIADLARATGLSRSYCSKLVNDDIPPTQPSASTLSLVCWALGFKAASFFYAMEQMVPAATRADFRIVKDTGWVEAGPDGNPKTVASSKVKPRVRVVLEEDVPFDVSAAIESVELPSRKTK